MNRLFQRIIGFFKAGFETRKDLVEVKNPWAGLSSYEDPLNTTEPLKFCGRQEESIDLFSLIDDNIVVTLYGKSGIGKTSLLNAGVFPILRQNDYMPLYVRLGLVDRKDADHKFYADQIIENLNRLISLSFGKDAVKIIDVIPESDSNSEDYLWSFFARRKFFNGEQRVVFPVIVLDQFEENIRSNREQSVLLLKQIAYLTNRHNLIKDSIINDELYVYDYNFRFVISIREDDFYLLEDVISDNYLTILRNGRYRLRELSPKAAKEVVLLPCEDETVFDKGNENMIADKVINFSIDSEGRINTLMLSLLCYTLYNDSRAQNKTIHVSDLEGYKDFLQTYYLALIEKVPEKQKKYIEDNLVDGQGRRKLVYLSDLEENVPEAIEVIGSRLLKQNGDRVELVHDQLASIIHSNRNKRVEEQRGRFVAVSLSLYFLIALYLACDILSDCFQQFQSISIKGMDENDTLFDYLIAAAVSIVLGYSGICAKFLLLYLIGFEIPKKICEYIYATMCVRKFLAIVLSVIISAILGTNWLCATGSIMYPLVGWVILFVTCLLSNSEQIKNGNNE